MSDPYESSPGEAPLDQRLLEELADAAGALTGFSPEAILPDALRRSARELLAIWPLEELRSRVMMRDPKVTHALRQAVTVGETFFFRQPEHFHFIQDVLVPSWIGRDLKRVRAWSAGCATGEEAFSVAAFLQDALGGSPQIAIEVVGTDLLTRNLAVARSATYGAWSQRPSAPLLAPLIRPLEGPPGAPPLVRVLDKVRAAVRFAEHNLLEPSADPEPFDLILCRNVLVYFAPEAARRAIANLSLALAPGGALMLGSMDLNVAPPELGREGQPESLIFRKSAGGVKISSPGKGAPELRNSTPGYRISTPGYRVAPPEIRSSSPGSPREKPISSPNAQSVTSPEPVSLHLRALLQIEGGQLEAAENSLRTMLSAAPGYLPGLFERALLHLRRGEPAAATTMMREVHRRASLLAPDSIVLGPEPLEARFYVESSEAYLRGGRG